jgi:hypothetical protein
MALGISEIFILLGIFFGGSFGLPMGVAPGPEDPMMFKIAPANCVLYASWTGIGELDKDANPTEAWMARPEIQAMVDKLRGAYRGAILKTIKKDGDGSIHALTKLILRLAETSSRNPTAFYLTDFQFIERKAVVRGAAMIGLGDQTDEIENALAEFERELTKESEEDLGIERVEIAGQLAFRVQVPNTQTEVSFGIRGKYFVFGFGKDSLTELAKNSKTDAPQWLTDARAELPVKRFSSMTYFDTNAAIELVKFDANDVLNFRAVFDPVIGDDVDEITWVSGVDDRGFLTRTSIHTADKLTGALSVLDGNPISIDQLDDFPADATVGAATRFSTKRVLELVENVAKTAGQEQALEAALSEFQIVTGMTLKDEFLQSIGDYVYFYYMLDAGKPMAGWVASVHIEDEMSFPGVFSDLNKALERAIKESDGRIKFEKKEIAGNDFFSFSQNQWSQVTWGLVDEQLYFAFDSDDISRHLKGHEEANQLSQHESVKAFFEFGENSGFGGPIAVLDLNLPSVLKGLWSFTNMVPKDKNFSDDFDFTFGDVPKLDVLIKNVQPNLTAVYRTKQGLQMMQRQTYPGSSPGVSIVAASVIGMPYVAAQFENAKKVAVQNNLRQLALSMHNFESAHQSFPAAYSSDKDGNKLLSWRVHVLPYIAQNQLYDEFHLDEPWDSEHNKSLIAKMPDVYKHASLKLPPGMTVYLGNTTKDGVLSEPKKPGEKNTAGTTSFGKISDGSSNTVLIVEVNAESAVPWTKPDDLPNDAGDVSKVIEGIRNGNKYLVAMCDGSVHMLQSENVELLKSMLTKNGGEVIRIPRAR